MIFRGLCVEIAVSECLLFAIFAAQNALSNLLRRFLH